LTLLQLAPEALDDLDRLLDHLLQFEAVDAGARMGDVVASLDVLCISPAIGRPLGVGLRELVIGKGHRSYVALYRYVPQMDTVVVLAIRAQREGGYR
jgi:toxin ParE1/3/4